jgi:hypothetical protein
MVPHDRMHGAHHPEERDMGCAPPLTYTGATDVEMWELLAIQWLPLWPCQA